MTANNVRQQHLDALRLDLNSWKNIDSLHRDGK